LIFDNFDFDLEFDRNVYTILYASYIIAMDRLGIELEKLKNNENSKTTIVAMQPQSGKSSLIKLVSFLSECYAF